MRRIAFFHSSLGHTAKVFHDTEWSEYRVKFYNPEGQHYPDADYHTDDEGDALDTARGQLARYKASE